ncbi:MAG TPA: Ppx/GppA phosphatase family protein [Thermoanaerobaculia bacterium]|nr:Ppx/GppA phosphatase family protein [Thermoanaerobaculia bacterium]
MTAVVVQPLAFPEAGAPPEAARAGLGRLAAIDIGSNSIHMIVIAPETAGAIGGAIGGGYRVLGREREMVRLGKTAHGKGALSETAMRDGLETLVKMTTLARLKGAERVVAVATSAVREAANGDDFLTRVKAQTGLDVQLLTGVEEGRLIYRAVREVVDLGQGPAAIVDVGGGSTEWISTRAGEVEQVVSLALGSLRCANDLRGDPPTAASLEKLRRRIQKRLEKEIPKAAVERLVATSGTAVCCADLVDFFAGRDWKEASAALREIRVKDLAQLIERLRPLPRREIADLPPVGIPRSESLLAGAVLLHELVSHAGADRFQVSGQALREGLVLAALGQPIPAARQPEDLRRRQVLRLAERTESVYRHSLHSARLAVRLFDVTASLHGLGSREREWLEYAALLHDIGYSIHYRNHHKHSFYLISNASLDAFDPREMEIIAHMARYHRGPTPKRDHPTFAALKPWQQRTIRQLTALLRVADSLDRTHASRVEEIYGSLRKRQVKLEVVSRYDVELELEAARARGGYFERVFDCRLRLRQGLEAAVT